MQSGYLNILFMSIR